MIFGKYYIETEPANNQHIDHVKDVKCKVFRHGNDNSLVPEEISNFIITGNELFDYGSLDKAIRAYMCCDYTENDLSDKACYQKIHEEERLLQNRMKDLLIRLLDSQDGHVTSLPVPDKDGCVEYPVSMFFYGRRGNLNISVTDVYFNENSALCVDGMDESKGNFEHGFQVCPEHYLGILDFLAIALGFKNMQ